MCQRAIFLKNVSYTDCIKKEAEFIITPTSYGYIAEGPTEYTTQANPTQRQGVNHHTDTMATANLAFSQRPP
jgi:hypothetical protein